MNKDKSNFVTMFTSPVTGKDFITIKDGQRFVNFGQAMKMKKTVKKQFGKTVKNIRVKRVSPLEKTIRKVFKV